jgi:hypothetical protein
MSGPPRAFFRIEWLEGFGWPECTRTEHTSRNYTRVEDAARQLAAIRRFPDHHTFIRAWIGRVEWEGLSEGALDEVLRAIEEVHDDDDDPRGAGDPAE